MFQSTSRFAFILAVTAAAAVTAAGLSAQASVTNYGRGCAFPSSPPPLIRMQNLPKIGTTVEVYSAALPNSVTPVSQDQPVLLTGLVQASIPVPPISPVQISGCNLLLLPLVYSYMPRSGSAYQGRVKISIPNDPTLIGFTAYQQWASIYRNCRSGPCQDQMVRVSDAIKIVIGA